MEISQGSLVVVGANTPACKVYWNGREVTDLVGVNIVSDVGTNGRVIIKIKEDPMVAEMVSAGIIVRRV